MITIKETEKTTGRAANKVKEISGSLTIEISLNLRIKRKAGVVSPRDYHPVCGKYWITPTAVKSEKSVGAAGHLRRWNEKVSMSNV